jgi:hypothetical protein
MSRWVVVVALVVLLGGCKFVSGPSPYGPDTYIVSHHNPLSGYGDDTVSAQAAGAFCEKHGKVMLPLSSRMIDETASLTFRCLHPGDPELRRPPADLAPD